MNCVRINFGQVGIEISDNSDITCADVDQAFEILARLKTAVGGEGAVQASKTRTDPQSGVGESDGQHGVGINTFVSTLGGGSCRNLLKAAALHLALSDDLAVFSKDQWFERASLAHEWQKSFASMRARDVKRLIASREIIEKAGSSYAVSSKLLNDAKSKLHEE